MSKTALFSRKQVGGVFHIEDQSITTGSRFFVHHSGASTNPGTNPDKPINTIDAAIALCTDSAGDIIYVMPGHAETVTSAITMDVIGVSIIGLGEGGLRPVITGNGTIDAITITAASCRVENIEFAVPGTDAQTADINIAAAGVVVKNTKHHGSTTAKNKVDIITITAAGHDTVIDGAVIYNDTVECVGGIVLEGAAKRVTIKNCVVHDSIGFTDGSISDEATALQLTISNCVFSNAKADTVCMEFGNNTTGVCLNTFCNGRHSTIASNITTGTGMAFYETYAVEEAAKNGMLLPAVDAE